ncbi:MAG: ATP-dependent zinc metalloprotease FtsH [Chitinophagales bacterium]|nr:MAG: ATP-dependent zinc metalloprotease FtsH [Chitinophagales bacterium]
MEEKRNIENSFKQEEKKKDKKVPNILPKSPKFNYYWIYAAIVILLLGLQFFSFRPVVKEIDFRTFEQEMLKSHDVDRVVVVNNEFVEVYIKESRLNNEKYKEVAQTSWGGVNKGPHYTFTIGSVEYFQQEMDRAQQGFAPNEKVSIVFVKRRDWSRDLLSWLLPIAILAIIWIFIMRRISGAAGGPGGQLFNIGKSKALLVDENAKVTITFKDVAGLDEAKEEVMEIVDFLKNPQRYTALGGKIPKGVILVGPPGTGKTLMAKAVAGEAKVPFFSISGSDFVEMFVGVGASRVRDLFKQAREKAPCIIFIDEIDAIGRSRGRSIIQGNDERENTLNQLLVEMDGFATDAGVIIMAATNRPDVLDSALVRPGRFDRVISIDKPDLIGREQIFKVHMKQLKLAKDVDPHRLATMTPGFAGAEIANVCNEAALIAARRNKKAIDMNDFNDAIDRVIGGLEKKNKLISPEEKKVVAYHEAGHAICGWFLEHADPLVKVSIIPRGVAALGFAQYLPREQYLYSTDQLMDSICMSLGGRAAEEIVFGKVTTGAQNDLERITKLAYSMVIVYGMNERVGHLSYYDPNNEYNFSKPYSEETARIIDEEVKKLIETCYQRTLALLRQHRNELDALAKELLEKEILYKHDLERIIGKRPFENRHTFEENGAPEAPSSTQTPTESSEPQTTATTDVSSSLHPEGAKPPTDG